MTNEAPTPDEVDTMMSDIGSLVRVPFQVSRGLQTAKKLRAYIAALKVKYHNAVMDLCEVKEVSEQLNDKVTALEAENNRLRSLIERSVNFVSLYAETQKAGKFLEELKSALAQTDDTCLRTTMSDAELEREAFQLAVDIWECGAERDRKNDTDKCKQWIVELAKKYREVGDGKAA